MAGFLDYLFGKGERTDQFNRFSPQQQGVQNQLQEGVGQNLGGAFDFLQKLLSGDPEMLKEFEAPARRSFQEQTLPGIAERFTGEFGEGANRSNAVGQQLGQAGAGLEENLSAQRGQLGMQGISQLLALLSQGQSSEFENVLRPGTGGLFGGAAQGIGGGLGGALGLLPLLKLLGR